MCLNICMYHSNSPTDAVLVTVPEEKTFLMTEINLEQLLGQFNWQVDESADELEAKLLFQLQALEQVSTLLNQILIFFNSK